MYFRSLSQEDSKPGPLLPCPLGGSREGKSKEPVLGQTWRVHFFQWLFTARELAYRPSREKEALSGCRQAALQNLRPFQGLSPVRCPHGGAVQGADGLYLWSVRWPRKRGRVLLSLHSQGWVRGLSWCQSQ